MKFEDLIVEAIEDIIPKVEQYRAKNVNKHDREKETEYGGEYTKIERYKNRVRVIDIFLPTLKKLVEKYHSLKKKKNTLE